MSHPATLKVISGTSTSFPTKVGITNVWGVAIQGSTNAAAIIRIGNTTGDTSDATAIIALHTNSPDATVFERYTAILFPAPIKFTTGLAVNQTALDRFWIYTS